MSNIGTTSNTRRHIQQSQCTAQRCIRLLLILKSMHKTATDRRWTRLHSKTPPAKNELSWQPCPSLTCESAAEHCNVEKYSKTGRRQDKTIKRYQKERPIVKYLQRLSHVTKPLSCSTRNRAKVLLKGHLSIERHTQYNKVSRLISFQSQWGWLLMNSAWPGDYQSLSLTAFSFIPHKSRQTLTMVRSRFKDSVTATLSPEDGTV